MATRQPALVPRLDGRGVTSGTIAALVLVSSFTSAPNLGGLRIVEQAPWLRHFTAKLAPL